VGTYARSRRAHRVVASRGARSQHFSLRSIGVRLGAGFISRTSIGYSWSSFTIGFRRSGECSPSFGQRLSFVGIGPAFVAIGVGNHALVVGPQISAELRSLIRQMSIENQLWARPASTANCSSLDLMSPSRTSPNTWSSAIDLQGSQYLIRLGLEAGCLAIGALSFRIMPHGQVKRVSK